VSTDISIEEKDAFAILSVVFIALAAAMSIYQIIIVRQARRYAPANATVVTIQATADITNINMSQTTVHKS
jgi:heme A synthase